MKAHPGDEPKNFTAVFGPENFELKIEDRPFPTGRDDTLTKVDPRYGKSWNDRMNKEEIETKGVIVIESVNGTRLVVPKDGKFKDMFQYLKDVDVDPKEKDLFIRTIFIQAANLGDGARVSTDGSEIDWLHVRVNGVKSGGSGMATTSLLVAAAAGALVGASS